jgi:hypothetical protein
LPDEGAAAVATTQRPVVRFHLQLELHRLPPHF